jgi:hypothetical protein
MEVALLKQENEVLKLKYKELALVLDCNLCPTCKDSVSTSLHVNAKKRNKMGKIDKIQGTTSTFLKYLLGVIGITAIVALAYVPLD